MAAALLGLARQGRARKSDGWWKMADQARPAQSPDSEAADGEVRSRRQTPDTRLRSRRQTAKLTAKPMRIVTHTCSNTEIVCALGLADWIVGVDDHSDYPPEVVERLPRIGPDQDINVDRVAALGPDLVVTSLTIPGHEQCVERLQERGLPSLVLEPTRLEHVPRDIRLIANALGEPDRGEALARELEDAFQPAAAADGATPNILVEWWPKPVIVPAAQSWVTQMLELVGAANPWAGADGKSIPLTDDAVRNANPDAVVISWCGVPFENYRPDLVRRREAWRELPALTNDRIYCVSEAWLGRPGPRLRYGLEALQAIAEECRGGPRADRTHGPNRKN